MKTLLKQASSGSPFFFLLLTLDTHLDMLLILYLLQYLPDPSASHFNMLKLQKAKLESWLILCCANELQWFPTDWTEAKSSYREGEGLQSWG